MMLLHRETLREACGHCVASFDCLTSAGNMRTMHVIRACDQDMASNADIPNQQRGQVKSP